MPHSRRCPLSKMCFQSKHPPFVPLKAIPDWSAIARVFSFFSLYFSVAAAGRDQQMETVCGGYASGNRSCAQEETTSSLLPVSYPLLNHRFCRAFSHFQLIEFRQFMDENYSINLIEALNSGDRFYFPLA